MRLQLPSYLKRAQEEEAEREVMGVTGHRDTGWYEPRDPPFNAVPGGKAGGSNDTQNTVNKPSLQDTTGCERLSKRQELEAAIGSLGNGISDSWWSQSTNHGVCIQVYFL